MDDIGEMAEVQEGELQETGVVKKVVEGEIDGVVYCDEYAGCMGCSARRFELTPSIILEMTLLNMVSVCTFPCHPPTDTLAVTNFSYLLTVITISHFTNSATI